MYIPPAFREEDTNTLVAFMQANSFATFVSVLDGVPCASHIPLIVSQRDNVIKLIGHLAKPNPQWKAFTMGESLAIFTGSHAYISPSLYEDPESVPTWNYIAVHAYGIPEIITIKNSPERMDEMIDEMLDTYGNDKPQWHNVSDKFREGMMNGIIGFEMTVTRLDGKYKLSQNRSQNDQSKVAHSLLQSTDSAVYGIGEAMQQNLDKEP